MTNIIEILALIILGLLGINSYQGRKAKSLKEEVHKVTEENLQKQKELEKLYETKKSLMEVKKKPEPKKIPPPEPGDVNDRLNRLNKLHVSTKPKTK